MSTTDAHTVGRIAQLAEKALRDAGVAGVHPTPLATVADHLRIGEIIDIADLPPELEAKKPSAWRKLLGALHHPSRTIFIDTAQRPASVTWTKGHEVGHRLLPWHGETAYLDDERRLFRASEEQREIEANFAAGHLIFQRARFVTISLDYNLSLATPLALAPDFDASFHSTIRYYAEHHLEPVGLLIAGLRGANKVPVWSATSSASFVARYGPVDQLLPTALPMVDGQGPGDLAQVVRRARLSSLVEEGTVPAPAKSRPGRSLRVEAFSNQHCLFVMLTPRRVVSLGRRVRVAS